MTSQLNVDTISDKAGTGPVGLTKQSAAKAWVNFDGDAATPAANDSFGLSSLSDHTSGQYTVNVTNAFGNANYAFAISSDNNTGSNNYGMFQQKEPTVAATTTALRIRFVNYNSSGSADVVIGTTILHGDLA
jgi:hypothetical protein